MMLGLYPIFLSFAQDAVLFYVASFFGGFSWSDCECRYDQLSAWKKSLPINVQDIWHGFHWVRMGQFYWVQC